MAGNFNITSDGHDSTLVTDPPTSAPTDQHPLTLVHTALMRTAWAGSKNLTLRWKRGARAHFKGKIFRSVPLVRKVPERELGLVLWRGLLSEPSAISERLQRAAMSLRSTLSPRAGAALRQ